MKRLLVAAAVGLLLLSFGAAFAQFGGGQTGISGSGPQIGPAGGPQVPGSGPMIPQPQNTAVIPPGCTASGFKFNVACNSQYTTVLHF